MWTNISLLWETAIEEYLHKAGKLPYMQTFRMAAYTQYDLV
jgi:hypothetical protein